MWQHYLYFKRSVQYLRNVGAISMGFHKLLYNMYRVCKLSVQKDSESDLSNSIPLASTRNQAIGKRIARAKRSLLKSTLLKVKILSTLVRSLSPKSKSPVFNNAKKSLSFKNQGRQQTLPSQFPFWKSLPLAIVLQGERALHSWNPHPLIKGGQDFPKIESLGEGVEIFCQKGGINLSSLYSTKTLHHLYTSDPF